MNLPPTRCLLVACLLVGCGPGDETGDPQETWDRGPNPHQLDDVLRLNHVQVKGTHNSYHLEPASPVDDSHRYSHPTLTEQLDQWGVRQLELDLHLREDGGWEVFHIPGIDEETTCRAFADCLGEIKDWSDDNGWHLPVVVWLEPKDDIDALVDGLREIGDDLPDVDAAILDVWPRDRVFAPDDLRGSHPDLPTALGADGWPLLGEVRGKVIFALLDSGAHRDTYLNGHPALEERLLFADTGDAAEPWAAMIKDGSPSALTEWGELGFLTTDNGSAAGDGDADAAAEDQTLLEAGVHHLATDLAAPNAEGGYWLDLAPRCNPLTAPPDCIDGEIERL